MSFKIKTNFNGTITKKDLVRMFWREYPLEHAWNYERMDNVGFTWALMPILKKLYPKKKDYTQALARELQLYNVTPYIATFPMGIAVAMEEQNSKDPNFNTNSINDVKTAMMGPLSGIGDAFFWGTLRILATGIGTSLAIKGNILGPILFYLIFNIPAMLARYYGAFLGYGLGANVMTKLQHSGLMNQVMKYASLVGMMVVGAMTMDMTTVKVISKIGIGKNVQTVQHLLDGIAPGILTLGLFGFTYWLLKKKWNPIMIMLLILVISIVGAYFKILGA